jgi:PAS domain-containing protein
LLLALLRTRIKLAQRHAFAEALQLEKERAQITLESIGDGVITTDVNGAIAYMNPAAESLTHWKAPRRRACPWRRCSIAG